MCEVAVTDLTTSYTTGGACLACGEGGEVIVEQETLFALVEHVVEDLLVELGAEGHSGQRLCLAAGEHCRSVRAGDIVGLAPDGADLGGLAAVQTDTFVEDATAHSLALHIVVVAFYEGGLLVAGLFGKSGNILVADGVEGVLAPVLVGAAGLGHGVSLVIALVVHVLAEILVVYFVVVFAFYSLACGFCKLELHGAVFLDLFVSELESFQKFGFRNFIHLTLDHHDVFGGGAYHQFHVGTLELLECGIDDELAVNAGHTHLRDGAVEGDVAAGDGCGSGQTGKGVGHFHTVGREHGDVHESLGMVVIREQRAHHTVHKARCEDFIIRSASLTFEETAGKTAC